MKKFLKPNKFKVVFSVAFITVSLLLFGGALLTEKVAIGDVPILAIIPLVLYLPVLFAAQIISDLPFLSHCFDSFGGGMTLTKICSPILFGPLAIIFAMLYTYLVSCLVFFLLERRKRIKETK